jgi:hypothetical protein
MQSLDNALKYAERGFSVIPCGSDKKPLVKWEPYQKRKSTKEEIFEWWTKHPKASIAIITGHVSDVSVIDIDEPSGIDAVSQYLPSCRVPTAKTPGGGLHLYFKTPQRPLPNNSRLIPGCDFRGEGGYIIAPPSVNAEGKAYEWLPGLSIDDIETPPLPEPYILFINSFKHGLYRGDEVKNEVMTSNRLQVTSSDFKQGTRDERLFSIANALIKGGMKEENALQVLELFALKCCDPPFPLNEAKEKIESAFKRFDKRKWNISEEVRDFVVTSSDFFLTSDCFNRLQVTSREEKKAVVLELLRLHDKGVIERGKGRNGCYRRIENQCTPIDLEAADDTPLEVRYPFGEERLIKTLTRHIVIIAGGTNSGKTAYALNMARLNMDRWRVHCFSSEMSASELKDRVKKFGMPLNEWRKVRFIERSDKFSDVVVSTDLNIIDYMEVSGGIGHEFYRIGEDITAIHNKLTTGIAIICLQKNPNQDLARGGLGSIEKSRLYISMDSGKAKITKGKIWKDPKVNPHKMELSFKLVDGCRFILEADWSKPVDTPSLYHETPTQYKFGRKKLGKDDLCKDFERRFGDTG